MDSLFKQNVHTQTSHNSSLAWLKTVEEIITTTKQQISNKNNLTDLDRTETPDESLRKSLLKYLGIEATKMQLEEAFCRDIDSFNSIYIVSIQKLRQLYNKFSLLLQIQPSVSQFSKKIYRLMMAPDPWHVRRFLQMCVQFYMTATNVVEGGHSKSSMAQKSTEK